MPYTFFFSFRVPCHQILQHSTLPHILQSTMPCTIIPHFTIKTFTHSTYCFCPTNQWDLLCWPIWFVEFNSPLELKLVMSLHMRLKPLPWSLSSSSLFSAHSSLNKKLSILLTTRNRFLSIWTQIYKWLPHFLSSFDWQSCKNIFS